MAAPPVVTCIVHSRVPEAADYEKALKRAGINVVSTSSAGALADFIFSASGKSVAFIVSPTGALTPEAAERAAKMNITFRNSYLVSLSGGLPMMPQTPGPWDRSPPRMIGMSGNVGDAVRFMLGTTCKVAGIELPVKPLAAHDAPPTAAELVDALAAFPGVPSTAAATALLCASGTLADLACAPPQALAAVGGLDLQQAESLAAAFQQPSQLMMPAAVTYKLV